MKAAETALVARLVRARAVGSGASAEQRQAALATFRSHPDQALAAIQRNNEQEGLTTWACAQVLEDVLGEVSDAKQARTLFEQHVSPDRRVELLQARVDLPSVASSVASIDDLCAVLIAELVHWFDDAKGIKSSRGEYWNSVFAPSDSVSEEDEGDDDEIDQLLEDGAGEAADGHQSIPPPPDRLSEEYFVGLMDTLRSWALTLVDRPDYAKLLRRRVAKRSIRDHLLHAVWYMAGRPQRAERVPSDMLANLRLNTEEHLERLDALIDANEEDDSIDPRERRPGFPVLTREALLLSAQHLAARLMRSAATNAIEAENRDTADKAKDAADF